MCESRYRSRRKLVPGRSCLCVHHSSMVVAHIWQHFFCLWQNSFLSMKKFLFCPLQKSFLLTTKFFSVHDNAIFCPLLTKLFSVHDKTFLLVITVWHHNGVTGDVAMWAGFRVVCLQRKLRVKMLTSRFVCEDGENSTSSVHLCPPDLLKSCAPTKLLQA